MNFTYQYFLTHYLHEKSLTAPTTALQNVSLTFCKCDPTETEAEHIPSHPGIFPHLDRKVKQNNMVSMSSAGETRCNKTFGSVVALN